MNQTIKYSLITTLFLANNLIADEKLQDITVTSATKTSQRLEDVTSNMNVITAEEIEERHYISVTEALNSLPGISFTSNGGLGKNTALRLRGMESRHTLILVDGIRYQDPSNTAGASIQHLIISDIERIEVVKGAQSGIWGADAAAGVINIITKKAKEGIRFHASQEFGSFNTSKTDLGLSYKNKDFYIKASHSNVNSQGFTTKSPIGEDINQFEDDAYNNDTSSIQAGVSIGENGKLEIGHTQINGLSEYDSATPNDKTMKSDTQTKLSHIQYSHKINNHKIRLKHEISDFSRHEIGTVPSAFFTPVLKFNGKTTNSEITDNIGYRENDFLIIGANQQVTEVDYLQVDNATNQDKYTNKGLFLTNSNKFWDNTILTESIRHDKYDNFDDKTTGKIGVQHTTDFGLIMGANYGTAYNAPNIMQVLNPYGGVNPNLQPEDIKSFDISVEHHGLKLTYFDQKIDNLINYDFSQFPAIYSNIEGTSKIKGYEIAYDTTINDSIALALSYTKLDAKDKDGKILLRRPKESFKFGVDYYGIEDVHLGLNGEYVGERTDKDFSSFPATELNTGKYTIANFVANYQVDEAMSLYAKVDNLTDKKYQTVYGYTSFPRSIYAGMKLTY